MNDCKNININIIGTSNHAKVIIENNNGASLSKDVNISDLGVILNQCVKRDTNKKYIKSPIFRITKGCRLIQHFTIDENSHIYVILKEKARLPMPTPHRFYNDLGAPNMLFAYKIVHDVVTSVYLCCIKDEDVKRFSEATKVYRYPFTNIHGFKLCTGQNTIEIDISKSDDAVYDFVDIFLSMPNLLYDFSSSNNAKSLSSVELFEYLENNDFNDDLLITDYNVSNYLKFINLLIN